VILRLARLSTESEELLGNFKINLDTLGSKGVQYFPFGQECVLQINLYDPSLPSPSIPQPIAKHLSARNSRQQLDERLSDQNKLFHQKNEVEWRAEFKRNKSNGGRFENRVLGNYHGQPHQPVH
jgi:hypothetical protein